MAWLVYLLLVKPELGLVIFWTLFIPILPLTFLVIPGLWRNICPLAVMNQLPRMTGTSMEKTLPSWARDAALITSILLFVGIIISRKLWLNHNALATVGFLVIALSAAFIGGLIFKGRSGWCGTFCPLAPLQKAYGQAPLVMVKNGYCDTCLGCQKNCYDFNPRAAVFSDITDKDSHWSDRRKFFVALLPGLIYGFFYSSFPGPEGITQYLFDIVVPCLVSVGLFQLLRNITHLSDYKLVAGFGLIAISLFYWNATPIVANSIETLSGHEIPLWLVTLVKLLVLVICIASMIRGLVTESLFKQAAEDSSAVSMGGNASALLSAAKGASQSVNITELRSGKTFEVKPEHSLLDAIESAGLPIMSGCRMGMCGSDPVAITEGMENLDPPDENELNTLRRLGLEGKARLACCCNPTKSISVDLEPDFDALDTDTDIIVQDRTQSEFDVIIIGNGIGGISVAEGLRQGNDSVKILVVSQEPHHFYNRIGLEQVINGKAGLQKLFLLPEDWYQTNNIEVWLNTRVSEIHREQKQLSPWYR